MSFETPLPSREAGTPATLEALLAKFGRSGVSRELENALALAVAAHTQRWRDEAADRDTLNRSTALWALLSSHPRVALAAAEGDLKADDLRDELHIDPTQLPASPDLPSPLPLDDSLAQALDEHLRTTDPAELDVLSVAVAILNSSIRRGGLLSSRLRKLGADAGSALAALERMRTGRPAGLSRSVRAARQELGPDAEVTAVEVVKALAAVHSDARFTGIDLDEPQGETSPTDSWLAQVVDLYDATEVLHSDRGVVDVELAQQALRDLDAEVASRFGTDAALMHWLDTIRPTPVLVRRTEPTADTPAKIDLLGRKALADTLLQQLAQVGQHGDHSMLVHLDGPWGSGKSSLFGFIEEAIESGARPAPGERWNGEPRRVRGGSKASGGQGPGHEGPTDGAHEDEGRGVKYLVVHVNAWREQRVGAQWWTLYRALRVTHLSAAGSFGSRLVSRAGHLWDVLVVRRDKLWPVLLSAALLAIGIWFVLQFGDRADIGVVEWVSIGAVLTTGLTAGYHFLVPVSPRSARALTENSVNPMAEVRDLFARSAARAAPRRVLFLIDDLDRCEPDYVIRFLEVVQTLVRDAPCEGEGTFRGTRRDNRGPQEHEEDLASANGQAKVPLGPYAIVAADGGWLRAAYELAYGELNYDDVPGKPLGYRFLEKIFQLHVRLPSVEAQTKQRYYESLLFPGQETASGSAPHDAKLERKVESQISSLRTTEDLSSLNESIAQVRDLQTRQELRSSALQRATSAAVVQRQRHELTPFADLLESNPRTIRLFVNAVSMQTYLRFIEGGSFELSGLALWAVLEARWPALADHLRLHPEDVLITDLQSEGAAHMPPDLLDLLTGSEVGAVLRSPRWDRFSPERVRACTGNGLLTSRS